MLFSDMNTLTKRQMRLISDLRRLYALLSLDFYDINRYSKPLRTASLELMIRAAVTQEVVMAYTLVAFLFSRSAALSAKVFRWE
jgi:hypothetical protein